MTKWGQGIPWKKKNKKSATLKENLPAVGGTKV